MENQNHQQIRKTVQGYYARIADGASCCTDSSEQNTCCDQMKPTDYSQSIGYSLKVLQDVPEATNLGLGCGNPTAFADIKPGETILDLGSGGGLDAFIAAKLVGESGKVIGVDMTPEMIRLARDNAEKSNFTQVEFRLGMIEDLPVEDETVDLVISNCVVNLSPDKGKVYKEIFRVLKPGGRMSISDPVRIADFPEEIVQRDDAYCGCIAGAASTDEITTALTAAGFENIHVAQKGASEEVINGWINDENASVELGKLIVSMLITAEKPC